MKVSTIEGILKQILEFKEYPDGTYSINTRAIIEYNEGYQVSFVRPEAFKQLSEKEWDILTDFYCNYFESIVHIGVYCGEAEVSFHSTLEEKALSVMEMFNQESILDWKRKKQNPDRVETWFIMNRLYSERKVLNYGEILEKIH